MFLLKGVRRNVESESLLSSAWTHKKGSFKNDISNENSFAHSKIIPGWGWLKGVQSEISWGYNNTRPHVEYDIDYFSNVYFHSAWVEAFDTLPQIFIKGDGEGKKLWGWSGVWEHAPSSVPWARCSSARQDNPPKARERDETAMWPIYATETLIMELLCVCV